MKGIYTKNHKKLIIAQLQLFYGYYVWLISYLVRSCETQFTES